MPASPLARSAARLPAGVLGALVAACLLSACGSSGGPAAIAGGGTPAPYGECVGSALGVTATGEVVSLTALGTNGAGEIESLATLAVSCPSAGAVIGSLVADARAGEISGTQPVAIAGWRCEVFADGQTTCTRGSATIYAQVLIS